MKENNSSLKEEIRKKEKGIKERKFVRITNERIVISEVESYYMDHNSERSDSQYYRLLINKPNGKTKKFYFKKDNKEVARSVLAGLDVLFGVTDLNGPNSNYY